MLPLSPASYIHIVESSPTPRPGEPLRRRTVTPITDGYENIGIKAWAQRAQPGGTFKGGIYAIKNNALNNGHIYIYKTRTGN